MKLALGIIGGFALGWTALAIWHGPGKAWTAYFFTRIQY